MLPADIVGTMIYNPQDGGFRTKHGPIFSNLILADEINRAPAKVQSALLEAMQERQVTIGETTYELPNPFLVLATQNPLEQEGTYPLPEAQVDRFMMKVIIGYPNRVEERAIVEAMATSEPSLRVQPVVSVEEIARARRVVNTIYVDDKIKDYIVDLVLATRNPKAAGLDLNGYIQTGASPRATINLTLASRAAAFLDGRGYVTPQDVKKARARRDAPPRGRQLRGRGREHHLGGHHPENSRHAARAVKRRPTCERRTYYEPRKSQGHHVPDAEARNPHAPPRQQYPGRRIPLGFQRPGHGLRRSARIRPRRRSADD
jgi:MoxR-like ATPase